MTLKELFHQPRSEAALLLAPALLVYATFAIYPMLDVVYLSFQQWNGLDPELKYVGLENYAHIFGKDPVFWGAFRNTIIWTILSVIFPPLLGLLLALALNQKLAGRSGFRVIFYFPVIIAPIAVATMWKWMYDPFYGLFSNMLFEMGYQNLAIDWLGDRKIALYSVFVAYIWQHVGFSMVLFLAGLQGVPQSLIEAAKIDGAGRFQVFRYVTFPAIRAATTIILVLSIISSLKAFDIIYGMTGGGPAQSTQMLALWAFTQSMQIFDFGKGSAVSVVLLAITLVIVVPYLRWQFKREEAER